MASFLTITQDIGPAVPYIRDGRVVAFPTGTSYGLAADALQGWAVQRVRTIKARPQEKALTVFVTPEVHDDFFEISGEEQAFLEQHAGQAVTLLLTPKPSLAHLAQDGRVGLRMIDHPLMARLAEAAGVPLTATSANRSGEEPARSPQQVAEIFKNPLPDEYLNEANPRGTSGTTYDLSLACILDAGELSPSEPSTIVRLDGAKPTIIRTGVIAIP